MKTFWGTPNRIEEPLLGKVTKKAFTFGNQKTFFVSEELLWGIGHGAYVTSGRNIPRILRGKPSLTEISSESLMGLHEGDIIKIFPNGRISIVWEKGSRHNVIFVTDKCDCRCIMCPQPPDSNSPLSLWKENKEILSMLDDKTSSICFSGGEPTLEMEQLVDLLALCKRRFPNADLAILTNGVALSDFDKVKQLIEQRNKFLIFCVSLDGDTDDIHDEIVGVEGAFSQAMRGLYNLARFRCPIELRFVIMKQNFERLPYYAEFVYRNLPFVSHIAFMGLEYTGEAARNLELIKIDPVEFADSLREAVFHLHRREMNVSIYNVPKCLLPRDVWRFARDSISPWKKGYLDICATCEEKKNCCGVFETSTYTSQNLKPIIKGCRDGR